MDDKTIPRQVIQVAISLSDGRNHSGEIQIDLDSRLSDFMNEPQRFFALKDKNDILKIINKDHVIDIRIQ